MFSCMFSQYESCFFSHASCIVLAHTAQGSSFLMQFVLLFCFCLLLFTLDRLEVNRALRFWPSVQDFGITGVCQAGLCFPVCCWVARSGPVGFGEVWCSICIDFPTASADRFEHFFRLLVASGTGGGKGNNFFKAPNLFIIELCHFFKPQIWKFF